MVPNTDALTAAPSGMSETQLAVIIVNWNTRDLLTQCLSSISKEVQTSPGVRIETFVVDNASTDGSAQMVQECFPWVCLIENSENVGFARANNQAICQSCGRYILLLNSDTDVHPGALETLVTFMEAHPKAGAAGARLLNADGTLQPSCHPMLTPWREFGRLILLDKLIHRATYRAEMWKAPSPQRVEVIKGACLLLRREALDQVGPLDESYFFYTEEVDLCYRLAQANWHLWWVPAATVVHYGEASSRQMAEAMYVQLYRSKIQFYRKFGGVSRVNCYKWLLRLAYWPRLVVAVIGTIVSPPLELRARTYRRLLAELTAM